MSTPNITGATSTTGVDDQTASEDENDKFYPNRVFINQLDSYHGKHFARILADKIFRDQSMKELGEGGEEQEELPEPALLEMPVFPVMKQTYQIVGTAKKATYQPTEDVAHVLREDDEESFFREVMKCGYVVYDITNDEMEIPKALATLYAIEKKLEEEKEEGPKKFAKSPEQRVFVLISPVMTWAKTRPVDPEDPDVPFVETDFRKRKPHPNYKAHIDLEKEVIAQGKKLKEHLMTIVIASAFTYGEEEEDLHFLFKLAWENSSDLPIVQPGHNTVPLINIKDLISTLYAMMENVPKKPKYIIAVEQTPCTQKQIVKTLSKVLGNDRINYVTAEEAFLHPDITQRTHERLTVNLKMEPNYIVNDLEIPWVSESNFCENIHKFIKEYKESRQLLPINMIIHGPPAVGKTRVAKLVAEHYHLYYISIRTLIEETLSSLRTNIEYAKTQIKANAEKEEAEEEEAEEEDEEEDWQGKLEEYTERLKEIERGLDEGENGKLPDHVIIPMLREQLQSNAYQNHGYVLDGFPKTIEQTKELFEIGEGDDAEEQEEEEEEGEEGEEPKKFILPHYVITLEASDEFICKRVMSMPESAIQGTHYTEEHMVRRLNEFRTNNTDENTMLNVFDEREIHPYSINAETDDVESILALIQAKVGHPFGYPPTEWELEHRRLAAEEHMRLEVEAAMKIKEEQDRRAREVHMRNMERWAELLQQLQHEEQQQLTAQCKPLREYLVRFVFPTLTRGLLETARVKPDDPVDFLAEYLFKENPEGRMFDPAYVAAADDMFRTIDAFQHRLGN